MRDWSHKSQIFSLVAKSKTLLTHNRGKSMSKMISNKKSLEIAMNIIKRKMPQPVKLSLLYRTKVWLKLRAWSPLSSKVRLIRI